MYYFLDDCKDTLDCSKNGDCLDIHATGFPTRQCFCNPGWFGRDCSRRKEKVCPILLVATS